MAQEEGNENDQFKCIECREWVLAQIDWECEVKTLFHEKNLGCGLAVSGAITWFFEHVEMGIILEDDCLAGEGFFRFCKYSLERFRGSSRILHITGTNALASQNFKDDVLFSKYVNVWGWCTWKEAWKCFDYTQITLSDNNSLPYSFSRREKIYWNSISNQLEHRSVDSWAYRWQFSVWLNGGLPFAHAII